MYQNVTGLLRTSELLPELREIVRAALAFEGELMPKVIYNGNGNTGGSVPVDNTNYAANGSFTVAGPGSLSQGSSPFFYWNTKADGTGTIFGPGTSTFPNQSTNLTLFAIWGVTTGLTNGGVTTHFNWFYDPSLGGAGGIEPARINQVLAAGTGGKPVIENDFDWLQAQFAGVDMTKAKPFPIPVLVTAIVESGYNASWGWPLVMNAGNRASTLLRSMFIAEVSEVFMLAQHKGWGYSNGADDEESCGEALSLFLTVQFQLSQGLGTTWLMNGTPSTWLNTSLPASNPASTEFDSTGQFGGPSTGTHYGARQDYVQRQAVRGQRPGDRLLHGVPLLPVPPASVHLDPAAHRRRARRRFQQQRDRRVMPEGRLPESDR